MISAPIGGDSQNIVSVLANAGFPCEACRDLPHLCRTFSDGAAVLILTKESLGAQATPILLENLKNQPPWSDIPIILITSTGEVSSKIMTIVESFETIGNITLLERPLRMLTLVASVQVAMRARRRQYQVRELLTQRDRLLEDTIKSARELAISNRELEQFAYIASHDLQEPLHVISSFTDLLSKRCAAKLENKEKEYISFIKQSALQAKDLIEELLEYSRIGKKPAESAIDLETVLQEVLLNLRIMVEDSKADVRHDQLPQIKAVHAEITQLFQNLISNAIKYRSQLPPQVDIKVNKLKGRMWLFSIQDNGIGIESQYKDRIFDMFQRLHSRSQYSGTGIGLAVCRKIVERYGGKIWVESQPGQGSTFCFTLPAIMS